MSSRSSDAHLPILEVHNVSKAYRLFDKPSDRFKQILFGAIRPYFHEHVALQDISFSLGRGETLGIMGRNGAGKSTLLQIITGTLQPSGGSMIVRGRVAALLELGTGINPLLTGRENIGLLAAILGLSPAEIADKTPHIVAFADLGEYIDQPVKTYSSGMYVRIAFAIATCVDPDLLIIDEALSVGDISFRNKCMARINELRAKGVSILFVSHDLSTLQMICNRAIWIEKGLVEAIGDPIAITHQFHNFMMGLNDARPKEIVPSSLPQHVTETAEFTVFRLRHLGEPVYKVGEDLTFEFAVRGKQDMPGLVFGLSIYRRDGQWIIGQTSHESKAVWPARPRGATAQGTIVLKGLVLGPGEYIACLACYNEDFTICHAMTELIVSFAVKLSYPTWGGIIHPIEWHDSDDSL